MVFFTLSDVKLQEKLKQLIRDYYIGMRMCLTANSDGLDFENWKSLRKI